MGTRWRIRVPSLLVVGVLLTACGGQGAGSEPTRDAPSSLPIAAAPTAASEAAAGPASGPGSASERMPAWDEPDDPAAAYRVLIDKVAYMRAHPSLAMVRQIYAPKSRMARERENIEQMIEDGTRVVDGRTVLEEVRLLSQDADTAFLRIRSREEGWVTVDSAGERTAEPAQCEKFVVELRDRGDGWRIANLIVDDESFRRCET